MNYVKWMRARYMAGNPGNLTVYLMPTWGRRSDMQLLRRTANQIHSTGEVSDFDRIHVLVYRPLNADEITEIYRLYPCTGPAQLEQILEWTRLAGTGRSESDQRLQWLWNIEISQHLMRANWDKLTTFDLQIAHLAAINTENPWHTPGASA